MLPAIPEKLWQIDESTVSEHFSLRATDQCYYFWEYTAGKGYDFSPTNQLIWNLKTKPAQIAKSPGRNFYKQQAINHSAAALRRLLGQAYAEQGATFVPVPGSKVAADPDHDDRMLHVLQRAFHGGLLLPVLGFIFLPLTTIVYAWEINSGMPTAGIIADMKSGRGAHRRVRRPRKPFVRAVGRFVAWALPGVLGVPNLCASMKGGLP